MKARVRRLLLVLAAAALLLDGGLLLAGRLGAASLPEEDTAYFLDVGEGDCTLLVSGGSTVLVDAGTPEGAPALVRELKSLGVRRLDAVIATHPHADHIGGMEEVLRAFPVRSFYMSAETQSDGLDAALRRRRLTPLVPYDGETLTLKGGASLTFLGPAEDIPADQINDRSLITLFQTGSASVLLMGDAEEPAEQSLLRHHPGLRCDILKVGHHGSDTSSSPAFLSALGAQTAIISCGTDNDYGHPAEQTLTNLTLAGVRDIRMTAESGTVVLPLIAYKENAV